MNEDLFDHEATAYLQQFAKTQVPLIDICQPQVIQLNIKCANYSDCQLRFGRK